MKFLHRQPLGPFTITTSLQGDVDTFWNVDSLLRMVFILVIDVAWVKSTFLRRVSSVFSASRLV